MNPLTLSLVLCAIQTAPIALPNQIPDSHFFQSWIPGAVLSLLGNAVVVLLGAWYRSEQKRKHTELLLALSHFERKIFDRADARYVRRQDPPYRPVPVSS